MISASKCAMGKQLVVLILTVGHARTNHDHSEERAAERFGE